MINNTTATGGEHVSNVRFSKNGKEKRRRLLPLVKLILRRHTIRLTLVLALVVTSFVILLWCSWKRRRLDQFPPLDDLVDRHRLWPPDLGEFQTRIVSGSCIG